MIKLLLKNNTIVAVDPDHKINEDELNKYLISLIDKEDIVFEMRKLNASISNRI